MLKYIAIVFIIFSGTRASSQSYDLLPVRVDSLNWGYVNLKGELVIKGIYEDANYFFGDLARVKLKDRYGYIDKLGNMVIANRYHIANDFSSGLALVEDSIYHEHFIDVKGNKMFGLPQGVDLVDPFKNGYCKAYSQYYTYEEKIPKLHYKISFMNTQGDIAFSVDADDVGDFENGMALTVKKNKMGYIDTNGKYIIEPKYDYIGTFAEGLAIARKNDRFGYIDLAGKEIVPFKYLNGGDFGSGLAPVCVSPDSMWVYIDHSGKVAIKGDFYWAESFREGMAGVLLSSSSGMGKRKKWGMIDSTGFLKVRAIFDDYAPFAEGLAAVQYKMAWGYINQNAEFVIEPQYTFAGSFIQGITQVEDGVNTIYIDKHGRKIYSYRKHKKERWW